MAKGTPWRYFNKAAERATRGSKRTYYLAALGVRSDGTEVYSANGSALGPHPMSHAEKRVCRKLDKNATVYIVRLGADGAFRLARPCINCRYALRNSKVKKVYYTVSDTEFGVIDL